MKVGFSFEGFYFTWHGGLNYYRNLFKAAQATGQCEIVIFGGVSQRDDLQKHFPGHAVVLLPMLDRGTAPWAMRRIVQKITRRDLLLARQLRRQGVEVLSHSNPLGSGSSIPCATWIADFQHVFLPHLFSQEELSIRNAGMRFACQHADLVFVSSQASAQDLSKFWQGPELNIAVLPFALPSLDLQSVVERGELVAKYDLDDGFLYVPNQFWAHKNHGVVVEAAKILRARGIKVPQFVFSGAMEDYRDNGYSSKVVSSVAAAGLEDHFRFLKVIPYRDVLSLMFHCRALINPSLFEGWSTTVEEAKILGQSMFLSHLPVHIEQAQGRAWFFDPHEPSTLAELIATQLEHCGKRPPTADMVNQEFLSFGRKYLTALSGIVT